MRKLTRAVLLLTLAIAALAVGACGSDDDDEQASQGGKADQRQQAFLQGMVSHHEIAIEMAEMAEERAERPQIKKLAGEIVSAQSKEIAQIKRIHRRLYGSAVKPDPMAESKLGLSTGEGGMEMGAGEMERLETAKPFDRAFIDAMVPHHQGAIRMARVALEASKDKEVMGLARSIIAAQSREITDMNSWRRQWYGSPSPAGGVPAGKEGEGGHSGMDGM